MSFGEDADEWKIIFFVSIMVMTVLFGLAPLFTLGRLKEKWREKITGISNAFAGGIFMASGFIHLLAESQEALHELLPEYPLGFLLSAAGFLVTFFMEKVVFFHHHTHHSEAPPLLQNEEKSNEKKSSYGTVSLESQQNEHQHQQQTSTKLEDDEDNHKHEEGGSHGHSHAKKEKKSKKEKKDKHEHHSNKEGMDHSSIDHGHGHDKQEAPAGGTVISKYLLLIVLSIHSVISGIAMGANENVDTVRVIGIAILSHKWIESFAVGVSLIRFSVPRFQFVVFMLIYSFMEPLGILIGFATLALSSESASLYFQNIAGAVASGTFIYVAAVDILSEEFQFGVDRYAKSVAMTLGFTFLAVLPLFFAHGH